MRELHAAISSLSAEVLRGLKHQALIFDKLYCANTRLGTEFGDESLNADFQYLQRRGYIDNNVRYMTDALMAQHKQTHLSDYDEERAKASALGANFLLHIESDYESRVMAMHLEKRSGVHTVPLFLNGLREFLPGGGAKEQAVLRVALEALPTPDESCAWQDLLDFKGEAHDKQWAFRRFLSDLATKRQNEAEIRDDIEWSLNEYSKAMEVHRLKSSQSFVDVFVISPLEIMEDLVKLNWSKIAKGLLQVRKREVELLEAELRAPGKECAYVFDVRRRLHREMEGTRSP